MDIHPETAQKVGITNGDWAYIETKRGRIKQKANVTETILTSVINSEASWWFPEAKAEEPSLHGLWESNASILTIDDPVEPRPAHRWL
jgi:anaerobic selenocysteine-containing dehydrogenase